MVVLFVQQVYVRLAGQCYVHSNQQTYDSLCAAAPADMA
jgi:hypothetical protein